MVKTRGARAKVAANKRSARKGEAKASRKTLAKSKKSLRTAAKATAPTKSRAKPAKKRTAKVVAAPSATQGHAWPGLPPGYFDRAR